MSVKRTIGQRPKLSQLPYSASAVAHPFCFLEFQKVVTLLGQGVGFEEIERRCVDENLFGLPKVYRAREIFRLVARRAAALDEELLSLFGRLDVRGRKIIALLTVIWTDRLFFEFLYEVYQEKLLLGEREWTDGDFNRFIAAKRAQSPKVAQWSEATLRNLRKSYGAMISGAGLTRLDQKKRLITPVLIDPRIEGYLRGHSMLNILAALTGVRK